jgi:TolA-binding protein
MDVLRASCVVSLLLFSFAVSAAPLTDDDLPPPLADAIDAYDGNKPLTASLALFDLLQDRTFPSEQSTVEYYLAASLYDLELWHASEHYFLEVVKHGPEDRWFNHALAKLVAIAAHTGDDSVVSKIAARVPAEDAPAAAREHLAYQRALREYDAGNLTTARNELKGVSGKSELYPRARYLDGLIAVKQGKLKTATTTFGEIVKLPVAGATARESANAERTRDLALLNIGRVHYSVQNYEEADGYFAHIPRGSSVWPESIFEQAWAEFMLSDLNGTLGKLLTLQAPSFLEDEYLPEAQILASLTWFSLCQQDRAMRATEQFESTYRPKYEELSTFVRSYASDAGRARADEAFDHYFGPNPAPTVLPKALFARVLRDRTLAGYIGHMAVLDAESEHIAAMKPAWRDTVGAALLEQAEQDRASLKRRAGLAMLGQMATLADDLGDLLGQAKVIAFESVDANRTVYSHWAEPAPLPPIDHAVSTDKVNWPFNGEFWDDELGTYRYTEQAVCR